MSSQLHAISPVKKPGRPVRPVVPEDVQLNARHINRALVDMKRGLAVVAMRRRLQREELSGAEALELCRALESLEKPRPARR